MDFDLKTLDEHEELLGFVNEHWIIFLMPIGMYLVGTTLGVFLAWLGFTYVGDYQAMSLVLAFIGLGVTLVVQHGFFMALLSLELSGWAITSQRVIDFTFLPYVRHDMMYLSIREINQIEKKQRGILKNLFHFGEVEILLSSSPKPLLFKYVPFPGRFVDLVSRLQKGS